MEFFAGLRGRATPLPASLPSRRPTTRDGEAGTRSALSRGHLLMDAYARLGNADRDRLAKTPGGSPQPEAHER